MNNRVLKYLMAVADTGHFGQAAERCEVSTSTLSGQLRRFEQLLGVELIERGRDGAVMTPAGQRILPWAEVSVLASQRIRDIARDEA